MVLVVLTAAELSPVVLLVDVAQVTVADLTVAYQAVDAVQTAATAVVVVLSPAELSPVVALSLVVLAELSPVVSLVVLQELAATQLALLASVVFTHRTWLQPKFLTRLTRASRARCLTPTRRLV